MAPMTDPPIRVEVPHAQIERFCERFGVARFSLFGSVLREDFSADSDVDVLLEFKPGFGFTFENTPEIIDEVSRMFGRRVDVLELRLIQNPVRRAAILNSHRVIHAA